MFVIRAMLVTGEILYWTGTRWAMDIAHAAHWRARRGAAWNAERLRHRAASPVSRRDKKQDWSPRTYDETRMLSRYIEVMQVP